MITRRQWIRQVSCLAGAHALAYPFKALSQTLDTVKILVGFAAGGTTDVMARRVAEKMRGGYGKVILVDNRPGAGGQIAITLLKDGPVDGSALLLSPSSMFSIFPHTYPKLPYKALEDVQPVSVGAYYNHCLCVGPAVPERVKTLKHFIEWAKANPDKANFGSPAAGSMAHLTTAYLAKLADVNLVHVPYRGSAPGIQDLLGGQVSAMSSPAGDYIPYLGTGKLRPLALSGKERNRFLSEVPTFREEGYPITSREWNGFFVSAKVSPAIVRSAATHLKPVLTSPDIVDALAKLGLEATSTTPQEASDQLRVDSEEWQRIVKQIGFKAEP